MIIVHIVLTGILIAFIIATAAGKGDSLIAGYNTASKQEQEQVDKKRMRGVVIAMLIATVVYMWALWFLARQVVLIVLCTFAYIVVAIAVLIWANAWCKKK